MLMSLTSDLLFTYLRNMFYAAPDAELDYDKLEEDFILFGKGLVYFAHCVNQYLEFADALARGDLGAKVPPPENELAAPLKTIHANLKHLTWQSQQVAKGDYKQRVDYMGEFADAFNTMVEQLADRQNKLEHEIDISRARAEAMEQNNLLLSNLINHTPDQIFVVSLESYGVLLANDSAEIEMRSDADYIKNVIGSLSENQLLSSSYYSDIKLTRNSDERFLSVSSYRIEWHREKAVVLVVKDVSDERRQLEELEDFAYHDPLTRAYNRFYGMLTLNDWIESKKRFSLVFVDLDNLKFINDKFGHREGDEYITRVSCHLQTYSPDVMVSRLGGDEYMMLIPNSGNNEVNERMESIQLAIQNDEHQKGRDFYYSISIGIVFVDETNELQASELLSMADERMYDQKRARKKEKSIK